MDKKTLMMIGAGAVVAVVGIVALKKASGAAGDALQKVNPFNNDNIINQGFTSLYQALTGSAGTIGTDFYDIMHRPDESKIFYTPKPTAGQVARGQGTTVVVPYYPVPGGYGDTSKYANGRDMVNINGGWGIE